MSKCHIVGNHMSRLIFLKTVLIEQIYDIFHDPYILKTMIRARTHDFQQCGFSTSVNSGEPVQPPFKLRNSKRCSVSSLTVIEYSSD